MQRIFGSFDNFDNYDFLSDLRDTPEEPSEDVSEYSGFRSLMNLEGDPNVRIITKILVAFLFVASVVVITVLTIVLIPVSVIFWLISGIYTIGEEIFGGLCGKS